jgi:hypothetical protein
MSVETMPDGTVAPNAPPCDADYGTHIFIRNGQAWPEDMAHLGFVGIASFRDNRPRQFFRCTDRDGHNRKERRAALRWRQQLSASQNRDSFEHRQTQAWLHLKAKEDIDVDDLLEMAGQ